MFEPQVPLCRGAPERKVSEDGKISFEVKEVCKEVCETFARESGLNYVRGDNSEGGRLGDAGHVDRKLTDSHSSSRPAT